MGRQQRCVLCALCTLVSGQPNIVPLRSIGDEACCYKQSLVHALVGSAFALHLLVLHHCCAAIGKEKEKTGERLCVGGFGGVWGCERLQA